MLPQILGRDGVGKMFRLHVWGDRGVTCHWQGDRNLRITHLAGMTLFVKQNMATNPLHIGLLCAIGVVLHANRITHLF